MELKVGDVVRHKLSNEIYRILKVGKIVAVVQCPPYSNREWGWTCWEVYICLVENLEIFAEGKYIFDWLDSFNESFSDGDLISRTTFKNRFKKMMRMKPGTQQWLNNGDKQIYKQKPFMRDIKEYIHHYLGCEVAREHKDDRSKLFFEYGKLVGISQSEIEPERSVAIIDVGLDHQHEWYVEETKPILRKLSSMTEEEFKEFKNICDADFSKMTVIESMTKGEVVTRLCHSAFAQSYLLSKHFDLFDLISSGLAIDKDKLEKVKL